MDYQLARLADGYDRQLQQIVTPPPEPATLIAARKAEDNLARRRNTAGKALSTAESELTRLVANKPGGLGARIAGARARWEEQHAAAEAKCSRLRAQYELLQGRLDNVRDSISVQQAAARGRHRQSVQHPGNLQRADTLRRKIAQIDKARQRLQIAPALAWGGAAMVLMAVMGLAASQQVLEDEFGSGPIPQLIPLTDLWGIGILARPRR